MTVHPAVVAFGVVSLAVLALMAAVLGPLLIVSASLFGLLFACVPFYVEVQAALEMLRRELDASGRGGE